jgi:hypothetical protein
MFFSPAMIFCIFIEIFMNEEGFFKNENKFFEFFIFGNL